LYVKRSPERLLIVVGAGQIDIIHANGPLDLNISQALRRVEQDNRRQYEVARQ